MTDDAILELKDISASVGGRLLFEQFALRLRAGEKIMLSGPSGCGKSYLLRCILGLAVPCAGRIIVFGRELNSDSVWALRAQMGYVAQEPDFGSGTVREALDRPFQYRANAGKKPHLERLYELFDHFHLTRDTFDKQWSALSGGERQRVALVAALLLQRPILLLDEASSALDPVNRDTIMAYFKNDKQTTVLSISHNSEWSSFCHRTVSFCQSADEETP